MKGPGWLIERASCFLISSSVYIRGRVLYQKSLPVIQAIYCEGDLSLIPGPRRSLEKEMATHSSILAWKILWTEETGRLLSMGSQRVGHKLATKQ